MSNAYEKNKPADLESLFTQAITSVMEPNQNLGMFLSGGVDSSTVLSELVSQGLRGMYSIAAFDTHTEKLFLARDFPGIKPLYWAKTKNGEYIYASEFPALLNTLKSLHEDCQITEEHFYEYLMYRDTLLEPKTLSQCRSIYFKV
ncbi:asparagine synthase-related protein [Peribacillus butanolivorans]|uniref:asparagine synthase-related protein n=1 Tax=Peribacillus butanolivorans TaxID=421767 RepID=UPI002E1F6673|nr:asparagine synthase-related protein [Peribacillus butanolivorans]MED3691005.1 asparagine synthase-related protein [Peribacillus butanolivorans]